VSIIDRLTAAVTGHTKIVIAAMLVLTMVVGSGAGMVEQSSSLDQFETGSVEEAKQGYIETNFTSGRENTTIVQVIVRNESGNALSKASLLRSVRLQQSFRENESINASLDDENPIVGVSNYVAAFGMLREEQREFEAMNESLREDYADLQARQEALNETTDALQRGLGTVERDPEADPSAVFERVDADTPVTLTDDDAETFERASQMVREAESERERQAAYALATYAGPGNESVLSEEYAALQDRSAELEERQEAVREKGEDLRDLNEDVQAGELPPLDEQESQLAEMNASEVEAVVETLLSDGEGGGNGPIGFMSASYEPGSTTADARMMVVFQSTQSDAAAPGAVSEDLSQTQLQIQELAERSGGSDEEHVIFGFGIISQETDQSMSDSLAIVGPLALLFVLVTLLVAYRDLLDIVLGFVGIFTVLIWTFGFMGWFDITFNQIMIAVPVLLIGLSIDYAIHIFMRHREARADDNSAETPRSSMRVAQAGVGVALIWVTATTVIGFMSNLISPLGPIQDFGVASSAGIIATLLIFGLLIPALKVELDGFLERRGFDRKKRAFGTGGGRFSQVLAVGSSAAKVAPTVVIVLALSVSVAGAYGATQVDTSFSDEDFIADDPPDYMYDLPEPFRPGEYSVKENLDYINDNFQREDQAANVLIEGNVTHPETLERVDRAEESVSENEVAFVTSGGDPSVTSPNSVISDVAERNDTMAAVVDETDIDGDGIPDENLTAVYDTLYEVAPEQASTVVHRDGGEYRAVQVEVSVRGGLTTAETTEKMRSAAAAVDDDGESGRWTATATGSPIVNEIVQEQLLDTVIESLLITLAAVFAFLMVAYRITEGSATLGVVTLLPVALSVSWILGTMYLIGMPFNVLTGMITSLTIGLGVAYSIHLSERFNLELERSDDVWEAMDTSVTGTGGALLGSAVTSTGAFSLLVIAPLATFQSIGTILALTLAVSFLLSVFVLPSLLYQWARIVRPTAERSLAEASESPSD